MITKNHKTYIPKAQLQFTQELLKGEEGSFYADRLATIEETVKSLPETYEQDGKGDEAIAYLHYFGGNFDWYITEKDSYDPSQNQAFGYVVSDFPELGYISIAELIKINAVQLDYHFAPTTLGAIKRLHKLVA